MATAKIVLLNWNGEEYLGRFLPGVIAAAAEEGVGVAVVDNGSTDGSRALLADRFPDVELVEIGRAHV